MKIVHVHDPAGVATTLVKTLRSLGHDAKVILKFRRPTSPVETLASFGENYGIAGRLLDLFLADFIRIFTLEASADVVHYHDTFFPLILKMPWGNVYSPFKFLDEKVLSALRRRIVFRFHGTELRSPERRKHYIKFAKKYLSFVSTPDLLKFLPEKGGVWIPNQ
jgi:hypothetical protein